MSQFLVSVVAMVVVLGVMIVVHEFGHYAAAKYFGVRVEVFSIGFGKRLLGFRKGDTDYRISAIPLGGYVKMSGENPMDERTGDPGEFLSHPRWQRFIIAVAGPTMNIVLAIGLLTGVYMVHYSRPAVLDQPAVLGWVEDNSAAAKAGLRQGDRLVRVDGIENPTWEQVLYKELLGTNQSLPVVVQRGDQTFQASVVPKPVGVDRYGEAGWYADVPIIITELEEGMPAEKAGLRVGDEVLAVNGVKVRAMAAMLKYLQDGKGQPVELTVLRNGQQMSFSVRPVLTDVEELQEKLYRVGIRSNREKVQKLPFPAAFGKSLEDNRKNSLLVIELVKKLVQRKVSIRQVEGPIRIGQAAGEAATEKGWTPLLRLTVAISLNLGIFNLLPIPILDGGVILLLLIEGTMRRDISLPIKERIYQAAFVFLVLFAVTVIYNDLLKTVPGLAQRLP